MIEKPLNDVGGGYNTPYQTVVGSLCATDYKWVQQQQVEEGKLILMRTNWNGEDISPTLTKNNAGGGNECLTKTISTQLTATTLQED